METQVKIAYDLFLMMLNLCQIKDREGMTRLFCESMRSIWPDLNFQYSAEAKHEPKSFQIIYLNKSFGYIYIHGFEYCSLQDKALIRNAVLLLGIVLANREQEKKLIEEKQQLQNNVTDHSMELKLLNAELFAANEEYMAVIKELKEAKTSLEEAVKAKNRFLSHMSHEIRTPLNGIIGMAELALMTDLTDEQKDYMHSIISSGDLLKGLMNQILQFSKMARGQYKCSYSDFILKDLIDETLKPYLYLAKSKGIRIEKEINKSLPAILTGAKVSLKEIIVNLIDNALKFTSAGSIGIEIRPLEKEERIFKHRINENKFNILFIITDTGTGIPKKEIKRIVNSLNNPDKLNFFSERKDGTGLGLPIISELIKTNEGDFRVISHEGSGTTFLFYLPFEIPSSDNAEPDIEKKVSQQFKKITVSGRVLVAEDNEINQKILKKMLEKYGCVVDVASNGMEVLDMVHNQEMNGSSYDLICMDIQMPVMDGMEATRILRKEFKNTAPIIAITAHSNVEDIDSFIKSGFNDMLIKPINRECITKLLLNHLEGVPQNSTY